MRSKSHAAWAPALASALLPARLVARNGRRRPPIDPAASAEAASLRYVTDARPGIRRRRAGRQFRYVGADGRPVRDAAERRRIRALAVPPAWREVWICPDPRGHLQATGRDARGRKQYRYHPRWRTVRDETKYARLIAFGEALPKIRARTARDLAARGLPRAKVLATVVRLLEVTLIRVGNLEYARANGSFGLTTLRARHVDVSGATVRFEFRGKGGKPHLVDVNDRRLAAVVRRCQALPGHELFQYVDETGARQTIGSGDVNDYLRAITSQEFTAKDFRTWAGTVLALSALQGNGAARSARHARRSVQHAIAGVAARLGNTPAICRKSYVHPAVVDAYLDGTVRPRRLSPVNGSGPRSANGLRRDEAAVMALLRRSAGRDGSRRLPAA